MKHIWPLIWLVFHTTYQLISIYPPNLTEPLRTLVLVHSRLNVAAAASLNRSSFCGPSDQKSNWRRRERNGTCQFHYLSLCRECPCPLRQTFSTKVDGKMSSIISKHVTFWGCKSLPKQPCVEISSVATWQYSNQHLIFALLPLRIVLVYFS